MSKAVDVFSDFFPMQSETICKVPREEIIDSLASWKLYKESALFDECHRREGYQILEVEDGGKCLELLNEGSYPDLILLDVMMPGLDGWTVCRRIKSDQALRSIPVCILSAKTEPDDVQTSLNKAGANWHLNKPVDRKKLLDAVAWLLKGPL